MRAGVDLKLDMDLRTLLFTQKERKEGGREGREGRKEGGRENLNVRAIKFCQTFPYPTFKSR